MSNPTLNFPLAKIKKICKLDPDVQNVSGDAIKLITFATESYVQLLAKSAFKHASNESRKTVQLKDIEKCIKNDFHFSILDGALTDWPEMDANFALRKKNTETDDDAKIAPKDSLLTAEEEENFNDEINKSLIDEEELMTGSNLLEKSQKMVEENLANKLIISPRPTQKNNENLIVVRDIEDF